MKNLTKTLLVATLSGGIAMAAFAGNSTDDKSSQRAERISKVQAERTALFKQADKNSDGKLSEAEFANFNDLQQKAWEARQQEFEKNRFARLDSNKDGALSQDELKNGQIKRAGFKHHKQDKEDQAPTPAV
jgi:Ca2+-binding EF-hand superfamily protein